MLLLADAVVFLISIFVVGIVWSAGVLRERIGWKSNVGNLVWWLLGCPVPVCSLLAQIVLFKRVSGANPFHDPTAFQRTPAPLRRRI